MSRVGGGLLSPWPQSSVDAIELHMLYEDGWNQFLEQGRAVEVRSIMISGRQLKPYALVLMERNF